MIFKRKGAEGFTLIELLVVVAIIGILSSVVLASLNSARSKGKDAAVKSGLASLRTQIELVADGGDYSLVCDGGVVSDDLTLNNIVENIENNGDGDGSVTCETAEEGGIFAVSSTLSDGTEWCLDTAGFAGSGSIETGVCISDSGSEE